jgi:heat shock protein HslJ
MVVPFSGETPPAANSQEHRMRLRPAKWARHIMAPLASLILLAGSAALAAERTFPDDATLLLEAKPMKGSKRVPILQIESKSKAAFDLWCHHVPAQLVVVGDTITILLGTPTAQQCDAERMDADEDLLATLQAVSSWSRQDDLLVLEGERPLRFRMATN